MTAVDPGFVDTNVLVYANAVSAPLHIQAKAALADLTAAGVTCWISRQIIREYLVVLSRPQTFTLSIPLAVLVADVGRFITQFQVAADDASVTANLLSLANSIPMAGKQIHDANIVATMQAYGLRRLLTHNTRDFARFGSLITVEPLIPTP